MYILHNNIVVVKIKQSADTIVSLRSRNISLSSFICLFLLNTNEVYSEALNVTLIDDELLVLHMAGVQDYVSQNNKE